MPEHDVPADVPPEVPAAVPAAELVTPVEPDERRYPSTIGGVFYLVVLAATGVGLFITWRGNWKLGMEVVGVSLLVAAALRLVLPRRDAGMLAVRHRLIDCVVLAVLGGAILFLALTLPTSV